MTWPAPSFSPYLAVQEMQLLQIENDKEELVQLDALQKTLNGKEYGYDHKAGRCGLTLG